MSRIAFWALLLLVTVAGGLWAIAHFSGGYRRFLEIAAPVRTTQSAVLAPAMIPGALVLANALRAVGRQELKNRWQTSPQR